MCVMTTSIASFPSKDPSPSLDSCVPPPAGSTSESAGREKSRLRQALGVVRRASKMGLTLSRPSVVQERPGDDASGAREGASSAVFLFLRGGDGGRVNVRRGVRSRSGVM